MTPVLILDTDMDTDCDDAGALALAMLFHRQGHIRLGAVVCDVLSPWPAAYTRAALHFYGLDGIPVGINSHCNNSADYAAYIDRLRAKAFPFYNQLIARKHGVVPGGSARQAEDAIALYRRVMATSEDHNVVICAVGLLSLLPALLASAPCEHSPLSGRDLVKRKVCELVTMANAPFPGGTEVFNWRMDAPHAAHAIADWPTPITVSWSGADILSAPPNQPPGNPIHDAYRIWHRDNPDLLRPSWDLVATLWAARQHQHLFNRKGNASIHVNSDATYQWNPSDATSANDTHNHGCLYPTTSSRAITTVIQNLLNEATTTA